MVIELKTVLFIVDICILLILLTGILWSVGIPEKRIWPPPSKKSWQYRITWLFFYLVFVLNTILIFVDWNSWIVDSPLRFILGIPLILIGSMLLLWGIRTLGTINTSGVGDGFIQDGPYRFTRNPQYLGDMMLFIGLSIMANSGYLWVTHILLILIFLITTLAEECWLVEQYGETYLEYLGKTSRFL